MTLAQDASSPAAPGPQARIGRAARQDKPWGHEMIFAAHEGKYIGKIIYVTAGQSLSLQYHTEKEETISVLSGQALVQHGPVGGELTEQLFGPGDTIDQPHLHTANNSGFGVLFAMVLLLVILLVLMLMMLVEIALTTDDRKRWQRQLVLSVNGVRL